ncbi:MAG: GAF domain-containing protein [Bacteroidales bacterium]|nr:GAF domain-containing protein [Bacteroidales bacterium]
METLNINNNARKEDKYKELLPQILSLIEGESDVVANLANIAAALTEAFCFFWCGFYKVSGKELVLGPFQGPIACTRIGYGKGVCGTAWKESKTVVVEDVDKFPGHIACSALSRSEIVVPIFKDGAVAAVLDIDSKELSTFDLTDARYLEELCRHIKL